MTRIAWDDSFGGPYKNTRQCIGHAICDDCIDMFDDLEYRGLCHTRKDLGMHFGQRSIPQSTGQKWMRW